MDAIFIYAGPRTLRHAIGLNPARGDVFLLPSNNYALVWKTFGDGEEQISECLIFNPINGRMVGSELFQIHTLTPMAHIAHVVEDNMPQLKLSVYKK